MSLSVVRDIPGCCTCSCIYHLVQDIWWQGFQAVLQHMWMKLTLVEHRDKSWIGCKSALICINKSYQIGFSFSDRNLFFSPGGSSEVFWDKCKFHNTNPYLPFGKNSCVYSSQRQLWFKWGTYQNFIVLYSAIYLLTVLGYCHDSCLEETGKKFLDFILFVFFYNLQTEIFKQIII